MLLQLLLLLLLQPRLALQPALRGRIRDFLCIFLQLRDELRYSTDIALPNIVWRAVRGRDVTERRTRREEREEVWGKFVCHFAGVGLLGFH